MYNSLYIKKDNATKPNFTNSRRDRPEGATGSWDNMSFSAKGGSGNGILGSAWDFAKFWAGK